MDRCVVVQLPVASERLGRRITGMAGNISNHGVYVRTDTLIEPGEIVQLGIALPRGRRIKVAARAVHALRGGEAHSLGRHAGIGFHFVDEDSKAFRVVAEMLDEIAGKRAEGRRSRQARLVVASSDPRLLDRMTTVLGYEGYAVEGASNGLEAYALCVEHTPEIFVAAEEMALAGSEALDVRVLYLDKPFTDDDLCARVAAALAHHNQQPS